MAPKKAVPKRAQTSGNLGQLPSVASPKNNDSPKAKDSPKGETRKPSKSERLEAENPKKKTTEPHPYRKVPWMAAQVTPTKTTEKIDILAEVRRAMALPSVTTQNIQQQAREESTRRWNACGPLSEKARRTVDELQELSAPDASPREAPTPLDSTNSSLHATFASSFHDKGMNFFSVGKAEEDRDLGRQRMSYAAINLAHNPLEGGEGKKVQDLFEARIALLRQHLQDSNADLSFPSEQEKLPSGTEDVLKEYRPPPPLESEVFHEEGFRRMRHGDPQGSLEVLEVAWAVLDHEMIVRENTDNEEIGRIREEQQKKMEERSSSKLKFSDTLESSPKTHTVEEDSYEVKMIYLRSAERLQSERQQKIAMACDLAMVYGRLLEWQKVDEVCEIVLRFYGEPGQLPTLSTQAEEEKWIHFMIRRAVACASLGQDHYPRCRSYLEDVLKLDPRHKRAKRCLQCVTFLEKQLVFDETQSMVLAALASI